jgi:signal transduction histidine kinase
MSAGAPRLSPSTILRYEQLEGIAERGLLDLVKLCAEILGAERCFAGLLHPDDGWPRTVVGITPREAREYAALFAYVTMKNEPTFVDDARAVEMFAYVPLVANEGGVRFFAGAPIVTSDGVFRGALVVTDRAPRSLTAAERRTFLGFAGQVKNQIELHTLIDELRNKHATQVGALSMLRGLLRAATTFAIIGTDPSGRITLFNEGAERMFGVPAREATAATPIAFLDMREVKARAAFLTSTTGKHVQGFSVLVAECQGDAPVEHTWTMKRGEGGGTFPGLLVTARVHGENGELAGYAFIARDITEQRAVERMKDDFVSMVSHELRTPLTAIRGARGLARGGVAGEVPEGLAELLHIAHSNTDRLLRIVNDILDVHRLELGALDLRLEPVDVLAVVRRAVDLTRPVAAEYGVSFRIADGAERATILADFERWVQVVMNLLSNAVKYSPSGSRVDVDVRLRGSVPMGPQAAPNPGAPSAPTSQADTWSRPSVRVTVTDRGPGVPDAFKHRIFEKFAQAQTGNMRGSGTGLGLSIVKSLVELHGGKVGFTSEAGGGTSFYVEQPLIAPATR